LANFGTAGSLAARRTKICLNTLYPELAFPVSLQAFSLQRRDLLRALQALPASAWSRGATFTATTQGRQQTVLSDAQRIAGHERETWRKSKPY
jgi:hypothetical protein